MTGKRRRVTLVMVVSLPERDAMFRARPDAKDIARGVQAVARAYRRSIRVEDVRVTFGRSARSARG